MIHKKLEAKAYVRGGQDWEMLFEFFDTNHDGKLTNEELRVAVRRNLGIPPAVLSDRSIRLLFNALDEDQSGSLELGEFVSFLIEGPAALKITEAMVADASRELKRTRDQKMPWLKRQAKAVKALKKMYPRRLGHVKNEKELETDFGWKPEISHKAEVKLSDGEWHNCEVTAGPALLDGSYTIELPKLPQHARSLVRGGRLVPEVLTGSQRVLTEKWMAAQKKDPLTKDAKIDNFPVRKHAFVRAKNLRPKMLHRISGKLGPEFEVGEKVEAEDRRTGRWYPAEVIAQPDLKKKHTRKTLCEYEVNFVPPMLGNEAHRIIPVEAHQGEGIKVRNRADVGERAAAVCHGLRSSSEAQRSVAAVEARSLARDRSQHHVLHETNLPEALEYAIELFHREQSLVPGTRQSNESRIGAFARITTPGTPQEKRITTPDITATQTQSESVPSHAEAIQQSDRGLLQTVNTSQSASSLPPLEFHYQQPSSAAAAADVKRRNKEIYINLTSALRMLRQKKVGKYYN